VTDDELTDAWEAVMGRAITHEEHLRIAYTLVRRYGRKEARRRLLVGTRLNCEAMDAADRFDPELTVRWANHIAACVEVEVEGVPFDDVIARNPDLRNSGLLGAPAWKRDQISA
jgi:hypothetical protein